MECEEEYQESVLKVAAVAKEIEKKWIEQGDANWSLAQNKPSMGISGGNYRAMGWVICYVDFSLTACSRCTSEALAKTSIDAGCRRNGDEYGSTVVYCKTCGFLCWSSY